MNYYTFAENNLKRKAMKKLLLFVMTAMLVVAVPTSAQQRKTIKKRATTTAKSTARKKPVSQPVTIQMDEPCIAGGAIAFNGIPIDLPKAEMESELKSQGFVYKKDEFGNGLWHGKAFGVEGTVFVRTDPAVVNFTEKKYYKKAQVRKRVMAYKDAFEEISGCKATESTMGWNSDEGGSVKIPINGGSIEIFYANCDEVDFSSTEYTLYIVYSAPNN
jgi:hypothetical protein